MQELIITVGLPGSGKSTYIENNFDRRLVNIISADAIKTQLPNYNPENAHLVHEKSIKLAEEGVYYSIKNNDKIVIMDGGGINNNYTLRIINKCLEINPNIQITTIFFNTPLHICVERIKNRERKVPISDMCKKNAMLVKCVEKLKKVTHFFKEIHYFTNEHIFIDMDGTICSYIKAPKDEYNCVDFVSSDMFLYLKPVNHVLDILRNSTNKNLYILTASPNSLCWEQKKKWLKEYFPEMKEENILFVGNKDYKHVFLRQFMSKLNLDSKDVTMIDDTHDIINKMIPLGINVIHPSNIDSLCE